MYLTFSKNSTIIINMIQRLVFDRIKKNALALAQLSRIKAKLPRFHAQSGKADIACPKIEQSFRG